MPASHSCTYRIAGKFDGKLNLAVRRSRLKQPNKIHQYYFARRAWQNVCSILSERFLLVHCHEGWGHHFPVIFAEWSMALTNMLLDWNFDVVFFGCGMYTIQVIYKKIFWMKTSACRDGSSPTYQTRWHHNTSYILYHFANCALCSLFV